MKLEKLKFRSKTKNFYVEPVPENLGIRFMQYNEYGEECIAMIIDNGKEFLLSSKNRDGMLINPFIPTTQLLFKDEVEDQLEVHTPHNKKIIVRARSKEEHDNGVIVAYEKDGMLLSVANCGAPVDGLIISLAK